LLEADDGILTLTSRRIRLDERKSRVVSITLDAVASCGLITKSHPWLIVFAAILALFGLYSLANQEPETGLAVLVGAAVLAAFYFGSRKALLAIRSAGDPIEVRAQSMSRENLIGFINSLETAKLAFVPTPQVSSELQAGLISGSLAATSGSMTRERDSVASDRRAEPGAPSATQNKPVDAIVTAPVITCPQCATVNPSANRFCESCGQSLEVVRA